MPVLPVPVPGAAVSPGINTCNFTHGPALTVTEGLVPAVLLPSVRSPAVTVLLPAVLKIRLKLCVPATKAALAGSTALASEEASPTMSLTVVTGFQLASTALTVTLNGVPATCAVGVPVLPVPLPGEAVSPGRRICSLVNAPALAVIDGLVLAVLVPSVISVDVTVQLPALLKVRAKVLVPADNGALAGLVSFGSVAVMPTVWVLLTRFQHAATALTVTLKALLALCAVGMPVLPVLLPGAALSPGANTCNFTNVPALTAIDGLVLAVLAPSVRSEAVRVCEPAVVNVTPRVWVPETKGMFAGKPALASLDAMPTASVMVFTTFQKLSTALTVMLKAVPALREVGAPVLPVAVPGAAISPGTNSWSVAKAAGLTTMLPEVAPLRPLAVKLRFMVVVRLWDRFANVTTPLTAVAVKVPCKVPLPALRATVTTVLLSPERRLPNASSMRTTGCCAKAAPAVAVLEGWVKIVSLLAAAGLTVTLVEVAPVRLPAAKSMVMVSALL